MESNKTDQIPPIEAQVPVQAPTVTQTTTVKKAAGGLAVAGMIVGICAVVFGWVAFLGFCLGVAAIILSIIGLKKKQNKGMSIAGIITGSVAILCNIVFSILLITSMLAVATVANDYGNTISSLSKISNTTSNKLSNYMSEYTQSKLALINSKKDFSKGETAKFGEYYEVKVNSITRDYVSTSRIYKPSEGKEYIVVNVSITNKDDSDHYFSNSYLKINDNGETDSYSLAPVESRFSGSTIGDGETETGNIVYEVTKGSKNLKLQYEMSTTDENYKSVKLIYTLALY